MRSHPYFKCNEEACAGTEGLRQHWGDNSTKDWRTLTADIFEEYVLLDLGPRGTPSVPATAPTTLTAPSPCTATSSVDSVAITNAISSMMLAKLPASHMDILMKNKAVAMT